MLVLCDYVRFVLENLHFFLADLADLMRPSLVAPVVAWLCHEECEDSGSIIEAAGGWAGKCELSIWQNNILQGDHPNTMLDKKFCQKLHFVNFFGSYKNMQLCDFCPIFRCTIHNGQRVDQPNPRATNNHGQPVIKDVCVTFKSISAAAKISSIFPLL